MVYTCYSIYAVAHKNMKFLCLILADIYWAGLLGPEILMILFTQCKSASTMYIYSMHMHATYILQ